MSERQFSETGTTSLVLTGCHATASIDIVQQQQFHRSHRQVLEEPGFLHSGRNSQARNSSRFLFNETDVECNARNPIHFTVGDDRRFRSNTSSPMSPFLMPRRPSSGGSRVIVGDEHERNVEHGALYEEFRLIAGKSQRPIIQIVKIAIFKVRKNDSQNDRWNKRFVFRRAEASHSVVCEIDHSACRNENQVRKIQGRFACQPRVVQSLSDVFVN